MIGKIDPLNELFAKGDYARALKLLNETEMTKFPLSMKALLWAGGLNLRLGNYEQALEWYRKADEAALRSGTSHLRDIAETEWFMGRRQEAVASTGELVKGLKSGRIKYSIGGGGLAEALLLRYFAVSNKDVRALELADDFIRKLLSKRYNDSWPVPLARFAIGKQGFEDTLFEAAGVRDLKVAVGSVSSAIEHRLALRQLVELLFHSATKAREIGNEAEALRFFRICHDLPNPLMESTWWLAGHEVGA